MNFLNYNDAKTLINQQVNCSDAPSGLCIVATVAEVATGTMHSDEWSCYTLVFKHDGKIRVADGNLELSHPDFEKALLFVSANSSTEFECVMNVRN